MFLTPFSPRLDATHGGGRSIAQLVAGLADRHDVALLCIRADDDPPVDDALRERCRVVEEFERRGAGRTWTERWSRQTSLLGALARGRPMWVADNTVADFAARAREVAETWRPDIVQLEFHVMAQYASAVTAAAPVVLRQHESGSAAARDRRTAAGGAKALLWLDELAWRRYERHMLAAVDLLVTFAERDRSELLRVRADARVERIPLGIDIPPQPLSAAGADPPTIVFIGNFMHPPNVDAANRLVRDIFPRVVDVCPTATLYIVGENPPHELTTRAHARVVITGRVPEVTPYLDAANVVAVPIRLGGGTRVKVLEALAAGKAVVASRRALEGLDQIADGEQALVAESDRDFAAALLRLLSDRELRVGLANRARQWASANGSCEHSIEAYEALYDGLLRAPARSPRALAGQR